MKVSGFWILFLVVGTALTFIIFSSPPGSSWFSDLVATNCGDITTLIAGSRKLKENGSSIRNNNKGDVGHVILDDYNPIDPVPSSKASIKPEPGPIEHGTPLMPYIPKPWPPGLPGKPGDSD